MTFCPVTLELRRCRPTLQPVGDDSVRLFALSHGPAEAAVGLAVGAHHGARSTAVWVQRGVGGGEEAGRVRVPGARVVGSAVAPEAVRVRLSGSSVPTPFLDHVHHRPVVPRGSRAGAAVGRRQQLPLEDGREGFRTIFQT